MIDNPEIYSGVILAAGRGTRIRPLSQTFPKPLLPVCNKPVMQYQIEMLRAAGIDDILVVVGHLGEHIREYFGDGSELGVQIRYVTDENPQGIASSLALAAGHVRERFVLFLGDIFLVLDDLTPHLKRMDDPGARSIIFVKHEADPEAIRRNFAVLLDGDDRIMRVIEKPTQLVNDLKGCGVYVFDETIFEAIEQTPRSALRNEYELTDAIQTLINLGHTTRAAAAVRMDLNLTFPQDLLACNLIWLREQGVSSICGDAVGLASGTVLDEVILGNEVQISSPVTIRQSVVFPNTHIDGSVSLIERSLVFPSVTLEF